MDNIQLTLESSTTSLSLNSDSIYLNPEIDGLAGLPEIRTTSGVNAGYNGGWTSAQFYDARLITIRGVISNSDISVVEDRRKALVGLLGQGRKEELTLHFVTAGGNSYVLNCRTISCEMALSGLARKQEFLIQLRADDPLIYDDGALATEAIVNVRRALGGFQIDFGLPLYIGGGVNEPLVENGNETVYPVINLYGPLHSPTIINQTTNQQMQVLTDLDYTLTWVNPVEVTGDYILVTNETDKESPLSSVELLGNTTQDGTPTPGAPVAVQTTTGEQVVKICGKNLFDYTTIQQTTKSGVSCSLDSDGTITLNGTCTADNTFFDMPNTSVYLDGTYTLSFVVVSGTISNATTNTAIRLYQANYAQGFTLRLGQTTARNTMSRTGDYVLKSLRVDNGVAFNNYKIRIQLEKNSERTDFEPYQSQSYEINLGKNLFDKDNIDGRNGYLYNNSAVVKSSFADRIFILPCQPNTTYTISRSVKTATFRAAYCDTDIPAQTGTEIQTAVAGQINNNNGDSITITTGISARYLVVHYGNANNDVNINESLATIQVEKGSQATSYAAYFTPIELCKLGDYQDKIYKSGDDWFVHKEVGKAKISELTWAMQQIGSSSNYRIRTSDLASVIEPPASNDTPPDLLCSHYEPKTAGQTNTLNQGISVQTAGSTVLRGWVLFYDSNYHSSNSLSGWQSTDAYANGLFYYALATATDTQITNQALIDQLDVLTSSTLFVGVNNIALVPSGGAQGELSIDYFSAYTEDRDIVVIDSQARTITKNGADIYYLKADGSEFPTLAPGENTLYLTSEQTSDEGYAEIKFKQGYLSI